MVDMSTGHKHTLLGHLDVIAAHRAHWGLESPIYHLTVLFLDLNNRQAVYRLFLRLFSDLTRFRFALTDAPS